MYLIKFLHLRLPYLFKLIPSSILKKQRECYLLNKFKIWYKLDSYKFSNPPKPDFIGFKNNKKISIELTEIPNLTDTEDIKIFNFKNKLVNILSTELKDPTHQYSLDLSFKDCFYCCFFEKYKLPKKEDCYIEDLIKNIKYLLSQRLDVYEDSYLFIQIKYNFETLEQIKIQNLYAEDSFEYYIKKIDKSISDKKNKNYKNHIQNQKLILLIFIEPISFNLSDLIEYINYHKIQFEDSKYFDDIYVFDNEFFYNLS
jgi:hypothetical protein